TIALSCSTILTEAVAAEVLQPFLGRPLSPSEQQEAADALTRYYLEQGYITSRALVRADAGPGDRLQLQVVEGGIERIDINGLERLREDYLRSRLALATESPLNSARLEDQLRLLRQSPLLENIEASLLPGATNGNSILRVRVEEADPFDGFIGLDNDSPPVLGTTQGTLALAHQNLTGRGDRLAGSVQRTTTGGGSSYTLGYAIPLNAMEGTLQVQGTWEQNRIPLAPGLDITGNSQTYSLSFRQPLTRTPREEFALSLGFDYESGQTFIGDQPFGFGLGPDPATGISRTAVLRFGQDYVSRDEQGAWSVRSRFSLGTGLFGATVNPDPIPDGQFISWLGQAQRVQRLSDDHLLIVSADVQLTPNPLLPSEKFVIGGAQTVRGYRQNLLGGDSGFRVSVEDRIALNRDEAGLPTLQLAPFVDLGSVWNVGSNPNPAPVQGFLASLGLGLIWEPQPRLSLRVDYGLPLIGTSNRGNTWQEQGIYFQLGYRL
ncbi:MAG TPA: ShlB/FhaC/HecB family hemolysin secretion/activation protein, partial [Nodosilinea sp.]|nr:ShlB/FhaC/HecB family hemolysin secretion/activation protein [Nodosilinea sp.]